MSYAYATPTYNSQSSPTTTFVATVFFATALQLLSPGVSDFDNPEQGSLTIRESYTKNSKTSVTAESSVSYVKNTTLIKSTHIESVTSGLDFIQDVSFLEIDEELDKRFNAFLAITPVKKRKLSHLKRTC